MIDQRLRPAPDRLPTLTEVLELGPGSGGELELPEAAEPAIASDAGLDLASLGRPTVELPLLTDALNDEVRSLPSAALPLPPSPIDEAALVHRVLGEVQPRIDALFEARLREALAPALARAADGLIRDVRADLAPALAEIVRDAVARAMAAPRAELE